MRYLDLAISLARQNPNVKWKLAAVGVKGGRVLSVAMNTFRQNSSPPGTIHYLDLGHHAETNCLHLSKTVPKTIYVARVNKKLEPALALPCPACYDALCLAGVRRVFFTTSTGHGELKL